MMRSLIRRCTVALMLAGVLALVGGGLTAIAQSPSPSPTPVASPSPLPSSSSQPCPNDISGVPCSLGRIADGIGAIHDFATDPVGALGKWILNGLTGGSSVFLGRLMTGSPDLVGGGFKSLWHDFWLASSAVFGIALMFRLFKQAAAESGRGHSPVNLLIDMGPRLLIFPAAALYSYDVIAGLATASSRLGQDIFVGIAANTGGELAAHGGSFDAVLLSLGGQGLSLPGALLQGVLSIVVICLFLYLVMLMAMRFVTLSFNIVIAPVAIVCGAYDTNNEVFQWWWRSTVGSLMVPLIFGAIGGVTMVMALTALGTPGGGGVATIGGRTVGMTLAAASTGGGGLLAADVFLIGGLWFMGKAIHHATLGAYKGHHFSGMLAAAEVGMFAWTRPLGMHKNIPGVKTAMKAAGGGGRGVRGGASTIADTAPARALLASGTPFANGFKREVVERGILQDEIKGYAAGIGMDSQTTMAEMVDTYLAVPAHRDKVYATTYGEWITTGRIDPLNPNNSPAGINARYNATVVATPEQKKADEEAAIRGPRARPRVGEGGAGNPPKPPVTAGDL